MDEHERLADEAPLVLDYGEAAPHLVGGRERRDTDIAEKALHVLDSGETAQVVVAECDWLNEFAAGGGFGFRLWYRVCHGKESLSDGGRLEWRGARPAWGSPALPGRASLSGIPTLLPVTYSVKGEFS